MAVACSPISPSLTAGHSLSLERAGVSEQRHGDTPWHRRLCGREGGRHLLPHRQQGGAGRAAVVTVGQRGLPRPQTFPYNPPVPPRFPPGPAPPRSPHPRCQDGRPLRNGRCVTSAALTRPAGGSSGWQRVGGAGRRARAGPAGEVRGGPDHRGAAGGDRDRDRGVGRGRRRREVGAGLSPWRDGGV